MTCSKMINPQPNIGDVDRNPPPRQCKGVIYKDGFCKRHHPDTIAEKELSEREHQNKMNEIHKEERSARLRALENKDSLTIENAIVLLVKNGYRVEKIIA